MVIAIMALTYKSYAVTVETTNNLNVYYPEYTKIDLICGQMPKTAQKDVEFCCEAAKLKRRFEFLVIARYFTNFTMQSIHIGLSVTTSTKTFAGCISSRARRSDI